MLGILGIDDCKNTVHVLIFTYLKLCRRIHRTYNLEPAGTHGVWNLDDYHFMPYVFGVAELQNRIEEYEVKVLIDFTQIRRNKNKFMLFWQVNNVLEDKGENMQAHSPTYMNISNVKFWNKVVDGMLKMFQGEVTSKLPVMNHFLTGTILRAYD